MRTLLILLMSLSAPSFAAEEKIECIGPEPENANAYVVYLHGAGLTGLHRKNIQVLKQLAEQKKVRFAIPISKWECKSEEYKGRPCWMNGPFDDNAYKPAFRVIEEAAEACFRNRDYGVLGFSNGAMLVTSIRQHCVPNKFNRMIAVGHGIRGHFRDRPGLRGCAPQLNVLIGDKDQYKDATLKSYELLKSREADITYEVYEGAHELKLDPLLQFFK